MTDLIERIEAELAIEAIPDRALEEWGREAPPPPTTPARPVLILLAVVLGCSAVLMFLTAAPRFSGWRAGAIALVVGAWVQVSLGVGLFAKVRRPVLLWVAAVNVAIAALWAVVLAGHHATTTFAASAGAALSGAAVVAALALALRPSLGSAWQSSTLALGSIVPVAVVVLTTTALALPTTVSASSSRAKASAGPTNPFFNSAKVPGQASTRFRQIASGNDSEKSELQPWVPLSASDQALLDKQLFLAEEAAYRYPTVADAKKAGMILAGGMAPGVGAHYQLMSAAALGGVNADTTINPANPTSWIYGSTADNAPVVGVMYGAFTQNAPIGFAGPNDHWHQHSNLCITYGPGKIGVPFAPDTTVTPQQCANVHGYFIKKTFWMVHAWVVPGWESPLGPFSHSNPHLYCPGNTDLTDAIGFCLRQQ